MIRILTLIVALSGLTALAASAAPVGYDLQPDRSEVGFIYTLNGTDYRGTMPVVSADITIDFQRFSASSVDVTVDVTGARTGLIFVTEALKAASGLDARNHPTIRFQSTAVRANDPRNLSAGGEIEGLLTIRGVTRPLTLTAAVFRQFGTAQGDLSQLSFRIKGTISRSAFGAGGFGDVVADTIALDIAARVIRAD